MNNQRLSVAAHRWDLSVRTRLEYGETLACEAVRSILKIKEKKMSVKLSKTVTNKIEIQAGSVELVFDQSFNRSGEEASFLSVELRIGVKDTTHFATLERAELQGLYEWLTPIVGGRQKRPR